MSLLPVAERAVALARAMPGGGSIASTSEVCDLPADPLAAFAAAEGRGRLLLWHGDAWVLAEGICHAVDAAGPGRTYHLAEAATSLRGRTVHDGEPPMLTVSMGFEDRAPGASHWGPNLPGGQLVLPRRLSWRRRGGDGRRIWSLPVDAKSTAAAIAGRLIDEPPPAMPPLAQAPWPTLTTRSYQSLVEDAVALLAHGGLRKVVLARAADHTLADPIAITDALAHLRQHADERTYLYAVDLPDGGCFVGATPELLFHQRNRTVTAMSLAGSRPRDPDADCDAALAAELVASTKERKEHNLVVEHIDHALRPRCTELRIPGVPEIRRLSRLQHLETVIDGTLADPDPFDVVGALAPTPAVAGLPTDGARDFIRRVEGMHRGLYTGCIGTLWKDDARFVVPLRGGIIRGHDARLFAGAGLVETSDPEAEFEETELKLRPMRQALGL